MAVATRPPGPPSVFGRPEPARAGRWSQAAAFATMTLAVGIFVTLADGNQSVAAHCFAALLAVAAGAAVGTFTPVGDWFKRLSALLMAMVTAIVLAVLAGLLASAGISLPPALVLVACAFVAGLDLGFVARLRTAVVVSGICVVIPIAALDRYALPAAFGWFIAAMVTLWLLNMDDQRALPRPEPLAGDGPPPPRRADDLVRIVLMALVAGFTLAFLFSTPSCSLRPLASLLKHLPWHPKIERNIDWDRGHETPRDLEVDARGHETKYSLDRRGRRYLVGSDGRRYAAVDDERGTSIKDRDGREVARFEPDGTLVVRGDDGDEVRYRRDDRGWYTDAPGGARYRVADRPEGTVLEDDAGRPVARPGDEPGQVRVFRHDPGLRDLDRNGDSALPVPDDTLLEATTGRGDERTTTRRRGGAVVVEDPSGETRTYRDAPDGRTVQVDREDGTSHTYRFNEDGDRITITDPEGERIGSSKIDRRGNAFDDLRDEEPPEPKERSDPQFPAKQVAIFIAIIVAVVVAVAVFIWWRRREDDEEEPEDRAWAIVQARRLEAWGGEQGRSRERAESIVRYCDALATGVAGDERLVEVGDILDDALFGRRPLPFEVRLRAQAVIDQVVAADAVPAGEPVSP